MLIELQNVVSQELKCLCGKTTAVVSKWTVPKTLDVSLDIFIALEVNEYICIEISVYSIEMCIQYTVQGYS
jgi:hypothetical protein